MTQRAASDPVLGYNHNLRHGGRVFHVQTEDSGQGYARLHTHLFYEGTILSSKKQEYDPSAPEDAVRALMQQLHKAMIRELTHGEHDARIGAFFIARGEPAMLDANGAPARRGAPRAPAPAVVESAVAQAQPELPPAAPRAAALPATAPMAAAAAPAKPVVMVKPGGVRRPPVVLSSSADGVVVRRNVVINVGGGAPPVNGTPGNARQPPSTGSRLEPPAPAGAGRRQRRRRRSRQGPARAPRRRPNPRLSRWRRRATFACRGRRPGHRRARSGQQPIITNVPAVTAGGARCEVKMPWDPPGGDAAAGEHGRVRGRARRRQGPGRGDPRVPVRRQRNRRALTGIDRPCQSKCRTRPHRARPSRCSVRRPAAGAAARKSCSAATRIPFETVDVTGDRQARAELIERANWRTVPVIFVEGRPIGGYRELADAAERRRARAPQASLTTRPAPPSTRT